MELPYGCSEWCMCGCLHVGRDFCCRMVQFLAATNLLGSVGRTCAVALQDAAALTQTSTSTHCIAHGDII